MSLEDNVRGYFSLRYVIPGFIFVLFIIALNIFPLVYFAKSIQSPEVFAAILAFVTILTGGAIGFVISQFYWFLFNRKGSLSQIEQFKQEFDFVRKKTRPQPPNDKIGNIIIEAILDFTVFLEKDKAFINHVLRRWDIYHVLRSSYTSLTISVVTGLVIRGYLAYFFPVTDKSLYLPEIVALVLVIVSSIILFFIFRSLSKSIIEKYVPFHKAFLTLSMSHNQEELKKAFPDYFIDEEPDYSI